MEEKQKKTFSKDSKLSDLDVEQFTSLMLSITETKGYMTAQREQVVSNQVFADAQGLITAAIQPFRAKTIQDVEEFTQSIKAYIKAGGTGVFVLAAALVDEDGKYRRL